MKAVNLLPAADRSRAGFGGGRRPLVIAGAVILVIALGFWGMSARQSAADARDDVARAEADQASLSAELGAYRALQERRASQELRRGLITGIASGRVDWERIVRDLATVMPEQTWLTGLKAQAPAATPAGAPAATPGAVAGPPTGVHLEGFAFTQDQVALLMARIDSIAGLGEPRLASSERQRRGARDVISFTIDVAVDQRVQDRPTLTPAGDAAGAPLAEATP